MIGGGPPPPAHGGILHEGCGLTEPAFTLVFTFMPGFFVVWCIRLLQSVGKRARLLGGAFACS
jgi:hypothetical protein